MALDRRFAHGSHMYNWQKTKPNPRAARDPLRVGTHLQKYYTSFESRLGYKLVLGGTRHFGYYPRATYWPFPITAALRAMEHQLIGSLAQPPGSTLLDAGCGEGYVAIHLARHGYRVHGIDITEHHIATGQANVMAQGLGVAVQLSRADYHNLKGFKDSSFDGAYTMETFVHATRPTIAPAELFRVIRPGGSLVMFEYDLTLTEASNSAESWEIINRYAAMPTNTRQGALQEILEGAGFVDISLKGLTENVLPMLRIFYVLAFLPYFVVTFFGLERWFVNTVAGYKSYVHRSAARYILISARKPAAV